MLVINERILRLADFGASWVLWLLVGLSVATLAVVLERAMYFVRTRDDARIAALLREGWIVDPRALRKLVKGGQSFEAQVLRAGLSSPDPVVAAHRMRSALQLVQREASRRLAFLGTVGSNAPFIGLLGTVIGVVRSFQELDASQGQVSSALMTEVGEALIATAVGILVAIPAVAVYNYFQQLITARLDRVDASTEQVLATLSSDEPLPVRPVEAPMAAPALASAE